MPYLAISDFKIGMDRRRDRVAGVPGSLWTLENAHITRGGDIERCKKFVSAYLLPANTFGLAQVKGQLFVFGSADLSNLMPAGIRYMRLQKSTANMTRVLDVRVAQSKLYVIAEFDDGGLYHFYDGNRITNFDTLAAANASYEVLATFLGDKINTESVVYASAFGNVLTLTARSNNTPFSISKSTTNSSGGVNDQDVVLTQIQAPAGPHAETRATGTLTVQPGGSLGVEAWGRVVVQSGSNGKLILIKIDGVTIGTAAYTTSTTNTAQLLSDAINANVGGHNFTSDRASNVVNIYPPAGTGVAGNSMVLTTVVESPVSVVSQWFPIAADAGNFHTLAIGGTDIITSDIRWQASGEVDSAIAVKNAINAGTGLHGFSATNVDATITITAPVGSGVSLNGASIDYTSDFTFPVLASSMAGGIAESEGLPQIYTAELIGTLEPTDIFAITIDGTVYSGSPLAAATGASAFVSNRRVFSPSADILRYTQIDDFDDYVDATPSSGAGFIPLSSNAENMERSVVVASYNGQAAVFAREAISFYNLSTDSLDITFDLAIDNTGTLAARSVIGYGNNDLYYLDVSGIRSLRARQGTDTPFVSDVGSPIDTFVVDFMEETPEDRVTRAVAAVEPTDGRFMLAVDDRIFVLSYFPSTKISAWSYYTPGITITDFVRARSRLYARDDRTIYLYGGANNDTYPDAGEQVVTVELPFLSANTPATDKTFVGYDWAGLNTWSAWALPEPNKPDNEIAIGKFRKTNYGLPDAALPHDMALFALRLECAAAGRAVLSSIALHYKPEKNPS